MTEHNFRVAAAEVSVTNGGIEIGGWCQQTGINGCSEHSVLAADVWDYLSGTSDTQPFDQDWCAEILKVVPAEFASRPLTILDLGAGAGNPAIGFAKHGHRVVALDADATMLRRCRARAGAAHVSMQTGSFDLRTWEPLASEYGHTFDVICSLGNALGYQDSWPNDDIAQPLSADDLARMFQRWSSALSPGGIIVLEVAIEPSSDVMQYERRFECRLPGGQAAETIWCVRVDPARGRSVDTQIRSPENQTAGVRNLRIDFHGHVLTHELIASAATQAELAATRITAPLRHIPLVTYVLRQR